MSEITEPETVGAWQPAWMRPPGRRALAVTGMIAALLAGAGVVSAQAMKSSEPKVIAFNRYEVVCDANWTCLNGAASALGHRVIGPTEGEQVDRLVALSSPDTTTEIFSFSFKPKGSDAVIRVFSRAGADTTMASVELSPTEQAAADPVEVAGQQGFVVTDTDSISLYVEHAGLNYVVTSSMDRGEFNSAIRQMRLVGSGP